MVTTGVVVPNQLPLKFLRFVVPGAGSEPPAWRSTIWPYQLPLMLLFVNVLFGRRLHRAVRAAAGVEEQDADRPVVGDRVLGDRDVVGLVAEDQAGAVVVDRVVVDRCGRRCC